MPYHRHPPRPSGDAERDWARRVTFCELAWEAIDRFWSQKPQIGPCECHNFPQLPPFRGVLHCLDMILALLLVCLLQ